MLIRSTFVFGTFPPPFVQIRHVARKQRLPQFGIHNVVLIAKPLTQFGSRSRPDREKKFATNNNIVRDSGIALHCCCVQRVESRMGASPSGRPRIPTNALKETFIERAKQETVRQTLYLLRWLLLKVVLEIVCTPRTRIESSQCPQELLHFGPIGRVGFVGIPCHHGVQQGPCGTTKLGRGGWTIVISSLQI